MHRHRRVDREQRRGLAEAGVDPRRARRDEPGVDRHLPDAAARRLQGPRRPLRRAQHPRESAGADRLAVGPDRARHLLQRRPARLRHLQPVPAEGNRRLRAAGAEGLRRPARSSSTTCSSTSAASSTPWIASPAGCTRWRWISDHAIAVGIRKRPGPGKVTRHERTLPLPGRRAVRAPAQARARATHAGDGGHRLPGRRQDHAAASAFSARRKGKAPRWWSTNSAPPASTTRSCAPAPTRPCCSAMAACAASRAATCNRRCAAWWWSASAARFPISAAS